MNLRQREPRFKSEAWLQLCRDADRCYLQFEGCRSYPVMPVHSNQLADGKCVGGKSHDVFVLPGCMPCHNKLDFGKDMSRSDKQIAFNAAWKRWILHLVLTHRLIINQGA